MIKTSLRMLTISLLFISCLASFNILPLSANSQGNTNFQNHSQAIIPPAPALRTAPLPTSINIDILSIYGISTKDISFSNIQPYSTQIDVGFYTIDSSVIDINQICKTILSKIAPELEKIDPNYSIIAQKFKIDSVTLTVFMVYMMNGQKQMQSIYITLPNTSLYEKLSKYQKTPSYTIPTSNSQLMSGTTGPSDPTIVSFLTASYADTLNINLIDVIMKYIIKTKGITQDFSILLINQIQYAMRFVLQLSNEQLIQVLISSDNNSPQILDWKRISSISDINPDVFSTFYRISPDEDLKTLVRSVFGTSALSSLKQIISSEKKISFDGVYYRIIVQSNTGNKYTLIFYYIPNQNYNEILQYQLMNNGYSSKKQTSLTTMPENDQLFNIAKEHLNSKYGNILQNTQISYAASFEKYPNQYYRFVFQGLNGKYQAIETVNEQTLTATISRWQKLQSGYVPLNLQLLTTNQQYAFLKTSLQDYISSKFGLITSPIYLQFKKVPDVGAFYKFTFIKPFPFSLTLEDKDPDHSLVIKGMERIHISPDNQYYNDRIFKGYSVVNRNQLQYDDDYQVFYKLLLSQIEDNFTDIQCMVVFRKQTPNGIYQKALYTLSGSLYLAQFAYQFAKSTHQLLSFQFYAQNIEPGDYRWMCQSINDSSKTCQQCSNDYILTSGRCYQTITGCTFQIASTCKVCTSGFVRVNHGCEKSQIVDETTVSSDIPVQPEKQTKSRRLLLQSPDLSTVATTFRPISGTLPSTPITISASLFSGPLNIAQSVMKDVNCLLFKGLTCAQCMYRYYLSNGQCQKAQDQCTIFNELTGICSNCSSGYYLNNNRVCIQLEPLCAEADSTGYCLKCYNTYVLIQGKCYAQSNLNLTPNSAPPSDSLCIEWTSGLCTKCQYGTYMSKKSGLCTIEDPFCQQFDENLQECVICQRGFNKIGPNQCQKAL